MKKKTSLFAKAIGVAAGVFGVASYLTFYEVMGRNAKLAPALGNLFASESGLEQTDVPDEREVWFNSQKFEEFEMINGRMQRLKGYFLPAEKPSNVYVFGSHGYRSDGKGEFRLMTRFYHDKGYNVFLVDHQASGGSDGKYIGFGYHEYADCLDWLNLLKDRFGDDIQIILHGVSMGCATVTMMGGSGKLPENVKFIVADCGYTSAYDEFVSNLGKLKTVFSPFLNFANVINKKISGYDFKDANPLDAVSKVSVPMLFIHGGMDTFVPTEMVYKLYEACSSKDKDLLVVEGAGHAESYPKNSALYESKVLEFIDKYIV